MNKKVALITFARFPSEMAYGIHLVQIAKSFVENNCDVNVYYPKTYNLKTINELPGDYYKVNSNINFKEINYINAHGTSTPANDKAETLAIKNVFNDHAYNLKINSTKQIKKINYLKLNIYPDGGISRIRAIGKFL